MDPARKAMLGQKWTCFSCGRKFYDLNRPEPTCPKCQVDQRESPLLAKPVKRAKGKKVEEVKPEPPPPPPPKASQAEAGDADEEITPEIEQEIEDIDLNDVELTGSEEVADEDSEED
jgi:hypothetical protein